MLPLLPAAPAHPCQWAGTEISLARMEGLSALLFTRPAKLHLPQEKLFHLWMDEAEQGGCRHGPRGCKEQVQRRTSGSVQLPGLAGDH